MATRLWSVLYDEKTQAHRHAVTSPALRATLVPVVVSAFTSLGVSASIASAGGRWWIMHSIDNVIPFEIEHGKEPDRTKYNGRSLAAVRESRRPLLGSYGGASDFFVPIVVAGEVVASLVVGPFLRKAPTAKSVLESFRWLSGRRGQPSDPQFAAYLAVLLDLLVVDDDHLEPFERLLSSIADLMSDRGDPAALVNRADRMRAKLEPLRAVRTRWTAVQTMLDDRTQRTWSSLVNRWNLKQLGLSRIPDHLLVGLGVMRDPGQDPVEAVMRCDAFQRAATELAMATGDAIAGRVGERGIVVLSAATGNAARKRQRLFDIADRLQVVGRRHGLSLHFGSGSATRSLPLSRSYEQALFAAERALADGVRIRASEPGTRPSSLRELRRVLARAAKERPSALITEFDRYIEAVLVESHQDLEVARGQLESGFERIAEPLLADGSLDRKGYGFLVETLDRSVLAARSLGDVFAAYRRAVSELSDALVRPVEAHRDRSLGRVLDHIHRHFAESLSFSEVAKLSGFAPAYFSQIFHRREGVNFETYVSRLRVERAKGLLETTELEVRRIAELSGFASAEYFSRVFRKITGSTPTAYKKSIVPAPPRSRASRRTTRL